MLSHLAGAEGFEPPNASTKNWCLTTWPRPNVGLDIYGSQESLHASPFSRPSFMPAQTKESNESTSWFDLSVKCEFVQITGQIVAY